MTRKLDNVSSKDRLRSRRFLIEFGTGMVLYLVALVVSIAAAMQSPPGSVQWPLALLPLLPVVWIAVATVRHFGRLDERERLQTLTGLGVGFVVAMLFAVSLGLLGSFVGPVPGGPWWIYLAGMLSWAIAGLVQNRR